MGLHINLMNKGTVQIMIAYFSKVTQIQKNIIICIILYLFTEHK